MSPTFTDDEIGKAVVTAAGENVGEVTDVEGETAYVDPDPGLGDSIAAAHDWGDASDRPLPVESDAVVKIDDETIRLEAEYATENEEPETDVGGDYRQDETDVEPGALDERETGGGRQDETDAEPDTRNEGGSRDAGRQDETDPEPDDLDETDPEMGEFDDTDPGVEGDPDQALTDAAGEIDGDRERRTDPVTDPLQEAGGDDRPPGDSESRESGTRDDVDVDPDEVTEGELEAEIEPTEDVGRRADES